MKIKNLADLKILVVGDRVWGRGDTLKEALKRMRTMGGPSKAYIVYLVHPESYVDEMGSICSPHDYRPKEIHRVGIKEKKHGK